MKLSFLVHRSHETTAGKPVEVNGETISAVVPAWEVELVSTNPDHGTFTARFFGKDVEDAKKAFVTGKTVHFSV